MLRWEGIWFRADIRLDIGDSAQTYKFVVSLFLVMVVSGLCVKKKEYIPTNHSQLIKHFKSDDPNSISPTDIQVFSYFLETDCFEVYIEIPYLSFGTNR
jgi:hypothetical protein